MSNLNSYNILINRFKAFADGHFLLKNFTYGAITLADLQKFGLYPFMHIVPVDVSYETGVKNFSFDVFFADLPREEENKAEYQKETLSDLQQIAEDLLGEITNHRVIFGKDVSVISSRLVPFEEEFSNVLTGWNLSITLQIPYNWSACDTPASFNDYIVYNQSTGESSILEFKDSIVREGGEVRLVNDVEFPDESYYYGTDSNGVRGWFAFPTETGLTCETLGACSTIIDIQTNITNLEDDVEDISANVVDLQLDFTTLQESLSPVATSGDYNDLDNLPTIPDSTSDLINDSGFITIADVPTSVSVVSHEVKLGSAMTKGTPVYVSSADGTNMVVSPASNGSEATSSKTMGLLMEGGNNNAKVQVITEGLLDGLNTSTATIGDAVWLGSTGTLIYGLANKPVAPLHMVFIGIVTRVNSNNGEIFVNVQNGFEIEELHNVLIESVADNQVLQYESATSLWKNKTLDKTSVGLSNVDNTSDANKPVSTATQTALNLKQDSLGYTALAGVHSIIPIASGGVTFNGLTANIGNTSQTGLSIRLSPYIPAQSITTSNLYIRVTTATAGSLCTIVIYSDTNGVPTNLLYESADLDCSTTGLKTAITSFDFVAGTRYWLGIKTNGTSSARAGLSTASSIALGGNAASIFISYQISGITYASPSPNPIGTISLYAGGGMIVFITKA